MMALLLLAFVGCGGEDSTSESAHLSAAAEDEAAASPVAGKQVAYVLNMARSEIFEECAAACVETAEKLGMTCEVFYSNGDDAAFWEAVRGYAEAGYDGLFLSHGGEDEAYSVLTTLLQNHPVLKIVTFDTNFVDAAGETQSIPGVTQFFQNDADLADASLGYICDELHPESRPVRVLKLWLPDYIAAFERRDIGYRAYEEMGRIETVATLGPSDVMEPTASVAAALKETLSVLGEDEVDVIWAAYDAYAQGAYQALAELGVDIPIVSIDLSDEDIACMLAEDASWMASAYTDFRYNGEQGMRILALEMTNDYEAITDPLSGFASNYLEIPASLVTAEDLREGEIASLTDLRAARGEVPEWLATSDWLVEAIGY